MMTTELAPRFHFDHGTRISLLLFNSEGDRGLPETIRSPRKRCGANAQLDGAYASQRRENFYQNTVVGGYRPYGKSVKRPQGRESDPEGAICYPRRLYIQGLTGHKVLCSKSDQRDV